LKTLYLDVCAYCRPFDNQQALRIRLETDAVYLILRHIETGTYRAVVSPVHHQEIDMMQEKEARLKLKAMLKQLDMPSGDLAAIRLRADRLYQQGFGIADAAHVAFAEHCAHVFITCDDKLLKKCRATQLTLQVMNPIEFVTQEDLQ
jgi:predicted nucleic acid-binding protein